MLTIANDLDLSSAERERTRILEHLDAAPEGGVRITLGGTTCTQISLQLFLAAEREARRRDLPVELCPNAASILARCAASPTVEASE